MATKKTTNKAKGVKQLTGNALDEANSKLSEAIGAVDEMPDGAVALTKADLEDPKYFYKGILPGGFRQTFGDEVTNVTQGQLSDVIEALKSVFDEEDGFRYFFKYVDNYIFTILVPLKYSNENESFLEYYKCHATSVVLRQGDVKGQILNRAKRIAKYIKYTKSR